MASLAGMSLIGALFTLVLAAKERDNRFCISCHLHEEKFTRLHASAPPDLAGFHQQKKAEVGCIACHGGADPVMRVRVWTVAAMDTLKFLAGTYGEPTHMRLPLRDVECRQCHSPILPAAQTSQPAPPPPASPVAPAPQAPGVAGGLDPNIMAAYGADPAAEGRSGTSYHSIRDHDGVDVRCVRCHTSHSTDSDPKSRFISKPTVLPVCRECHKQM